MMTSFTRTDIWSLMSMKPPPLLKMTHLLFLFHPPSLTESEHDRPWDLNPPHSTQLIPCLNLAVMFSLMMTYNQNQNLFARNKKLLEKHPKSQCHPRRKSWPPQLQIQTLRALILRALILLKYLLWRLTVMTNLWSPRPHPGNANTPPPIPRPYLPRDPRKWQPLQKLVSQSHPASQSGRESGQSPRTILRLPKRGECEC